MAHLVRNDLPDFKCWVSIVILVYQRVPNIILFFLGGVPSDNQTCLAGKASRKSFFFLVMNPTYHTPLVNRNLFICREPYQKYSILDGSINEPDGSIISRLLSAIVAPSSKNWGYISDQQWGVGDIESAIPRSEKTTQLHKLREPENNHPTQDGDTHDFMIYSWFILGVF
jgi:hypothetical protein